MRAVAQAVRWGHVLHEEDGKRKKSMVGSPWYGYVGFGDSDKITAGRSRKPFTVIGKVRTGRTCVTELTKGAFGGNEADAGTREAF